MLNMIICLAGMTALCDGTLKPQVIESLRISWPENQAHLRYCEGFGYLFTSSQTSFSTLYFWGVWVSEFFLMLPMTPTTPYYPLHYHPITPYYPILPPSGGPQTLFIFFRSWSEWATRRQARWCSARDLRSSIMSRRSSEYLCLSNVTLIKWIYILHQNHHHCNNLQKGLQSLAPWSSLPSAQQMCSSRTRWWCRPMCRWSSPLSTSSLSPMSSQEDRPRGNRSGLYEFFRGKAWVCGHALVGMAKV